jgi:hypothetical protein
VYSHTLNILGIEPINQINARLYISNSKFPYKWVYESEKYFYRMIEQRHLWIFRLNVVHINFLQIAAHAGGISCISAGIKIEAYIRSRGITWGALCSRRSPPGAPPMCVLLLKASSSQQLLFGRVYFCDAISLWFFPFVFLWLAAHVKTAQHLGPIYKIGIKFIIIPTHPIRTSRRPRTLEFRREKMRPSIILERCFGSQRCGFNLSSIPFLFCV